MIFLLPFFMGKKPHKQVRDCDYKNKKKTSAKTNQQRVYCCPHRMHRYFEFIYLYASKLMFQIDQKTGECAKVELTEAWDPFDIPDNSTFEDQYIIGGPGDNVEVQEWSDRKPARKREITLKCYHTFSIILKKNVQAPF